LSVLHITVILLMVLQLERQVPSNVSLLFSIGASMERNQSYSKST